MDNTSLTLILVLFASYMMGSFPTSMLIGKLIRGIDIREQGSGNAGDFNVHRVLGWKPALVLVVFDIFKGWAARFGCLSGPMRVLCCFRPILTLYLLNLKVEKAWLPWQE